MSSILTNNGAMVALQTLKGINSAMAKTQSEISTGKAVANAKDNAAVWAISKVMESDVAGFKAISDSLSLGESTVAVARNATETVTDLLKEIKTKIVGAQEANVDRAKLQTDIDALTEQITSVVGAAQFNGLNLINGSSETPVKVLGSLDRAADGTVAAKHINVDAQDLSQTQLQLVGTTTTGTGANLATLNGTPTGSITVGTPTAGYAYGLSITATDGATPAGDFADGVAFNTSDATDIVYVAKEGDTAEDVATGIAAAFAKYAEDNALDTAVFNVTANGADLEFAGTTSADNTIAVSLDTTDGENIAAGGLAALANIDVSSEDGAEDALNAIEGLIQTSIDAASSFGSVEKRINIQNDFVGKLTDSMKVGIGSLVDANMEETSARLQALQVQQQLGIQSLSMANQAPQSILSLFR